MPQVTVESQQEGGSKPEEPKRSWFRRHKIMTAVLAIIALFVVVGVASGDGDTAGTTPEAASAPAAERPDSEVPADEAPPTSEGAPVEESPGLGDPVRDGKFEFVVQEVEYSSDTVGGEFLNKAPQGQYALVSVSITNIGDEPQTMFADNQYLYVGEKRYAPDTEAAIYASNGNDPWLAEINPGNSISGVMYFDIPKGSKATTLELHDSAFSGGVDVNVG